MKNCIVIFLLCLMFGMSDAFASSGSVLTLQEFLYLVKKNDPEFKKLRSEQEKINFLVDGSLPSDAWLFSFSSEYGFGNDDIDTRGLSASVSKELFETGSVFSASHARSENPGRNEELTVFSVEQPLLRNAFGRDNLLRKKSLGKREQLAYLQAIENYENYISAKAKLYLEFSQAAMEVKLSESILQAAEDLFRHIEDKFKRHASNQTDVRRARLQVILRKEDLLRKQENFETYRNSVLLSSHAVNPEIYPETDFNLMTLHQDRSEMQIDSFVINTFRRYQIAVLNKEAVYKEYQLVQNDEKANLSLIGGYKIDESTRFTSTVNREEAVIGLKLSMPFKDNKAAAQASIVALELKQGELDQYQVEREIRDVFDSLKGKLLLLEKEYALSKEKVALMKAVFEEDTRRYNLGRIDTTKIIEVNNEYARYQFEHRQKLLELNKSYIDWLSLNDRLVSSENQEWRL